ISEVEAIVSELGRLRKSS
ncbi:DUF1128 family protein, partial [Paenibacillus sp. EKM208P]